MIPQGAPHKCTIFLPFALSVVVYIAKHVRATVMTVNSEPKSPQNSTSQAKGRQFTVCKVIQPSFSIDPCTFLAIYRFR